MGLTDIAALVGALATAAAATFAGYQILELRRDKKHERQAQRDGVAVSWETREQPRTPDDDGWATWMYEITAHNPGRLPIKDVNVVMTFPRPVRRRYYDGHLGETSEQIDLGVAVLVGGASKTWKRALRMPFDESASLRAISAEISFRNMTGELSSNTWAATTQR